MTEPGSAPAERLPYERALELLDQKLKALEDADLSLDEALKAVEEARDYLRICQQRLDEARARIEVRPEGGGDTAASTRL
ncbi:MAG: exodeoxyribonuclease VII small subunit [Candidatus Dormibacteraeota bacterium]|nr:exodeoxyribonuclease VII small subunit [Candidatus Dormibacteraeota bacterium]